jgi:crotonobetainyl-CoA:carnitine CoA-transferase CaiB-like acyl-CoA transferase
MIKLRQERVKNRLVADARRRESRGVDPAGRCGRADPRDTPEGCFRRADERVTAWATARPFAEIDAALLANGVLYNKIYDIKAIYEDPFFTDRDNITVVPDEELGPVRMQGIVPKLPGYDLKVRHAGVVRGTHTEEVLGELGLSPAEVGGLRQDGVI